MSFVGGLTALSVGLLVGVLLACCFNFDSLISIFFSCNSNGGKKANVEKESYEETKNNLLVKEQKNPVMFLVVNGNNKSNQKREI